jgi:Holliday junction DNA helicase RuvB
MVKVNFLKQLFCKTREVISTDNTSQSLARSKDYNYNYNNKNISIGNGEEQVEVEINHDDDDEFFEYIIGYYDVKRFLKMSINAEEPVHILLLGPPASAKTMFIRSLMKLQNSYFTDGGNSTKSGMLEYIFDNKPKYLLIDEIDKMPPKDQTFLLNLMETGIVSETKHKKTRTEVMKTRVFASSNKTTNIISALRSRFFTIELERYSYEQFCQITVNLLTKQHKVNEEIAKTIADAVWNKIKSKNIRDCIRIGRMAKSVHDVNFIVNTLERYRKREVLR